jgi:hypothetical protein
MSARTSSRPLTTHRSPAERSAASARACVPPRRSASGATNPALGSVAARFASGRSLRRIGGTW